MLSTSPSTACSRRRSTSFAEFLRGRRPAACSASAPLHAGFAAGRARARSRSSPRTSSTPQQARAAPRARGAAQRPSRAWCATCPRSRSAIRSCTSSTASAATSGSSTLDLGEGATEFLQLEYADGDKLYVPVSQLHLISRYSGAPPEQAPLHKLGSGQWEKAKRKAAAQVRDTAAELLNLYAQRAARAGPRVRASSSTTTRRSPKASRSRRRPTRRPRSSATLDDLTSGQADGPAGLRRRRLRQDRGGAARGVRRGRRRQAGRGARADDAARRAALPHVLRPLRRLAGEDRRAVALPHRRRSRPTALEGLADGPHRHRRSARTSCFSATSSSRTSGSSSSTRSTASACARRSG